MKFDDLDAQMRIYETAADYCVLPGIYMVARLDGRSFTTLCRKKMDCFEAPYSEVFRDIMVDTVEHLMKCGFKVIYGYTQSDEISLLFDFKIDLFNRKIRKYNSILAGEASAAFSSQLYYHTLAVFDCRICQLPNDKVVIDYFRWRNEDANRNALNSHCYWMLRKQGNSKTKAALLLSKKSVKDKNELLFSNGINFNDLPDWQKRGVGIYWAEKLVQGYNSKEHIEVENLKKQLVVDFHLPMRDKYSDFIAEIIANNGVMKKTGENEWLSER
jgi:tRNA(His) 5'-end guanylyltransferase